MGEIKFMPWAYSFFLHCHFEIDINKGVGNDSSDELLTPHFPFPSILMLSKNKDNKKMGEIKFMF